MSGEGLQPGPSAPADSAAANPGQGSAEGGPPPPAPPPEKISPKLAALMRKEADAVKRVREAKTLEGQIKAREDAIAAREAKNKEIDELWRTNPLRALQERGYDYNQLTMVALNGGNMTPEQKIHQLSQEIQSLRQERQQERTQTEEQAKTQADQELEQETKTFQKELGDQLEAAKDKFPLTHLYKRVDLIYDRIDQHFNKTLEATGVGEVLEFDKVAELVESAILKEAKRAQEILSKSSQAAPTTQAPPQASGGRFQSPPSQSWVEKPVKTLAGLQQSVPSQSTRVLSDDERIANALARLRAAKQR